MNRYEIIGTLGRGGMGTVYRARDRELGRQVAIKRLHPPGEGQGQADGSTGTSGDSLLKEARMLSSFQHPNIVAVYDVGADADGHYLVMELVEGKDIDEIYANGAMGEADFRRFASQALQGLAYAQERGLQHRDIKPSNIMLAWGSDGNFQVKILDFGLAKISSLPALQTLDQSDSILGSIYFMAPEQFERLPLDPRTDLYSLGCICYTVLAARYAFDGETAAEVMENHLSHRVTPLGELRPDLPSWLTAWVMNLMSRQPDDRPANARSALEIFEALAKDAPLPPPAKPDALHPPTGATGQLVPGGNTGGAAKETSSTIPQAPKLQRRQTTALTTASSPPQTGRHPTPAPPPEKASGTGWRLAAIGILAALAVPLGLIAYNRSQNSRAPATPELAPAIENPLPTPEPTPTRRPEIPTPPPKPPDKEETPTPRNKPADPPPAVAAPAEEDAPAKPQPEPAPPAPPALEEPAENDTAPIPPEIQTPPAPPQPADTADLDPLDTEAINAMLGETITVSGIVRSHGQSRNGWLLFLNFAPLDSDALYIVIDRGPVREVWPQDKIKALVGERIRVTGTVGEYRDKPQIKVSEAGQILAPAP